MGRYCPEALQDTILNSISQRKIKDNYKLILKLLRRPYQKRLSPTEGLYHIQ